MGRKRGTIEGPVEGPHDRPGGAEWSRLTIEVGRMKHGEGSRNWV